MLEVMNFYSIRQLTEMVWINTIQALDKCQLGDIVRAKELKLDTTGKKCHMDNELHLTEWQ